MAQRKVLIKYFPKNFDHQRIQKRGRGKDKLMMVRNMLPCSLRCNTCGNYLYMGTKFNMRMQICNEETYLGIKVFRFYFKCTICYGQITFKTDPKNHDYLVQTGGTRNYEVFKDGIQAEKYLKRIKANQKQQDSMQYLQNKSYDSKRQMDLMEALEDIKNQNKRQAIIDPEDLLKNMIYEEQQEDELDQDQQADIQKRYQQLKEQAKAQKQAGTFVKQPIGNELKEEQIHQKAELMKEQYNEKKQEQKLVLSEQKQTKKFSVLVDSEKKVKVRSVLSKMKKKIIKPDKPVKVGEQKVQL